MAKDDLSVSVYLCCSVATAEVFCEGGASAEAWAEALSRAISQDQSTGCTILTESRSYAYAKCGPIGAFATSGSKTTQVRSMQQQRLSYKAANAYGRLTAFTAQSNCWTLQGSLPTGCLVLCPASNQAMLCVVCTEHPWHLPAAFNYIRHRQCAAISPVGPAKHLQLVALLLQ